MLSNSILLVKKKQTNKKNNKNKNKQTNKKKMILKPYFKYVYLVNS